VRALEIDEANTQSQLATKALERYLSLGGSLYWVAFADTRKRDLRPDADDALSIARGLVALLEKWVELDQ
jgi:hypothetical protein